MNKRAFLVILSAISVILPVPLNSSTATSQKTITPSSASQTTPNASDSFPWVGTFLGINAPTVSIAPLVPSGPFQSATLPSSLEPQTANPFSTSASSISTQATQTAAQSITSILTNDSTPFSQQVNGMFARNTTLGGAPMKITPGTKYRTPIATTAYTKLTSASFTQGQNQVVKPAQQLFPGNAALTQAYENFMGALQLTPGFFPLFKKLHITALHQIYLYLVGIYTSLNMTHIDDLKSYMITEKQYALNKKTLIVNHLLNIVMAQLNQAIRAIMPGMPENYAIVSGMNCMQSDSMSDPNMLVLDLEKSVLAVLGLQSLDASQTSLAYNGMIKYMGPAGVTTSPDLQAALTILNSTNFSVKLLSPTQTTALSNAITQILGYLNQQQNFSNIDQLIACLQNPTTQQATSQQITQLATLVSKFAYMQPLTDEIALAQNFAQLLGNGTGTPSATPLYPTQIQGLRGVIGYILQQYEQTSAQEVSQVIEVLGKLNPTYQTLSPTQSLDLKPIAVDMLLTQSPLLLEDLTDTERSLLAYGLWVTSNNTSNSSLSAATRQTLQSIAIPLKESAMSMASLSTAQQTTLQQALTTFSTYELAPLTSADFNAQMESKLSGGAGATSQQNDITQALQTLQSPSFTSFNQLTTEEQILLLQLFQMFCQVYETRLAKHQSESSILQYLLAQDPASQKALFASISSDQYETLNVIDSVLETSSSLSCAQLAAISCPTGQTKWISPQTALLQLFTVPASSSTTTATASQIKGTSYLNILLLLQQQHFQNQTLTAMLQTITPEEATAYQTLLPVIYSPNFSFTQIDPVTRTALAETLRAYKQTASQQSSATYTTDLTSTDPTQNALETIGNVITYHSNFSSMRNSFLWALKEYLVFFNLYAQTLQNISTNPSNPSYTGLTEFSDYAQNIITQLNYQSSSNNSIAQLTQQANPPLFFYDPTTFRGIRLLPKLAAEVENSSIAPYPTFGIEQASSATGTALDPISGKTTSNTNAIGSFSYQKFFFLQAPDSTTELTGTLPSWITQTTVPSSTGTTTIYTPNAIPNDGITGFYMNIPTFSKDPNNQNSVIIRLYEQPVIAQPAWLNSSGATSTTPQAGIIPSSSAGVITLLRGCLGDFEALLDLDIFDPCLTVIFSSALALSTNPAEQAATKTIIQDKGGQCAAYIVEKQAMLQAQQNPAATVATGALSNASQPQGASITAPGASQ